MFRWTQSWPHWLRATMAILLYVAIWSNFSLPALLRNDPFAFQAAGSIIVAWAIITIGRERFQSEESLQNAQYGSIVSALNRLEKHREVNEERLSTTFDLHLFYISQNADKLGIPNPNNLSRDDMRAWAMDLNKILYEKSGPVQIEEDQLVKDSLDYLKEVRETTGVWVKLQRRVEIVFLVFGTLQWGYGNKFVEAIYSNKTLIEILNSPI
jgi:hypothetical protein